MNKAILLGRITKDLELKHTASGLAVLKFTVAVNRFKKGEADFINCLAWDKTAELINTYFKKGSLIAIEGRIQTGSYDNKEGKKVYTTEVVVERMHFTGEKKDNDTTQTGFSEIPGEIIYDTDELPF